MRPFWIALLVLGTATTAHAADRLAPLAARVERDAQAGRPIVIEVHVALCDNALIACGGRGLGDGDSLATNLYWATDGGWRGAFERAGSRWRVVSTQAPPRAPDVLATHLLERTIGTRRVQLRVHAWRGRAITQALAAFLDDLRGTGAGGQAHLVAFVGHNGLMDLDRPALATLLRPLGARATPVGAVAIACATAPYLRYLDDGHRVPLLLTTDLLFASSHALAATIDAFVSGRPLAAIRTAGAAGYAAGQGKPLGRVLGTFTNPSDPRWLVKQLD